MNVKRFLKTIAVIVSVLTSHYGRGFEGLDDADEQFAQPKPNSKFEFPRDYGAHPDYRIEWWYLTANLNDVDGHEYGLQWTLFRTALRPFDSTGWASPQIWFAHAAITTSDYHLSTERYARGGIGQAGVEYAPFNAWIDEWSMKGVDLDSLTVTAGGPKFHYQMDLKAQGPLIFHGENGFSLKSPTGQASYYYSQPFYQIEGIIDLQDGPVEVSGEAWMDREWSSQLLSNDQTGWDWFSLSFDSGAKLMGFQLRNNSGEGFSAATWIEADGRSESFGPGQFFAEPELISQVTDREIPTQWHVKLPAKSVDIKVKALNPNAWMDVSIPYWEGPIQITGTHPGRGYLEMTGYE
ncbi:iron ABC transporter permease [Litoricolaceae bacterium]|nr:iron ABC transporter permease [Litorivicinaceae bacterium]